MSAWSRERVSAFAELFPDPGSDGGMTLPSLRVMGTTDDLNSEPDCLSALPRKRRSCMAPKPSAEKLAFDSLEESSEKLLASVDWLSCPNV